MIAFSIIGVLSLVLIYFVLRFQNAQRELILTRTNARVSAKRATNAYRYIMALASEQQHELLSKLESANTSGLIKTTDYQRLQVLFSHFSTIVMFCSEKDATVEEAINSALKKEEINLLDVREVIKNMPNDVRMSWSRNSCESFIAACVAMTRTFTGRAEKSEEKDVQPGS
ncbi:hypothetical protein [Alteromonas halophila]|uniref:Uncharacterized protein n=1 Tax=Alteromonas halophila TaxID=516698 RepID=A0A918JJX7_9ALTE|nr:hypothetical protein [Alteromonas halophila]GGW85254.1 hypothetical protein GCM10007391_18950 [Alteromonas halophila]